MNRLNRFIRRNQKKFLAFFSAALMVVFIITLAPQGWRKAAAARDQTIGTLDGKDVTRNQLVSARGELQLLSQLEFTVADNPQMQRPLLEFLYGDVAQTLDTNGTTFFLLLEEAKRQSLSVDQEEVQTLLKNNVTGPDRALADGDLLTQALTDGMAVRDLLDQAGNVIKITKPLRQWELSRADQNLVVSAANFPAARFKDKIPPIKDDDIKTQFDSFKDTLPGQFGSTGNPLGFGYKIPNRVQVQYIGIRGDDAKAAAKASKSEQDWYIAAYHTFEANRETYDQQPVVVPVTSGAATQPQAASTRPTTRMAVQKLDDDQADWALHSSLVLDDLYLQESRKLEIAAAKKISETMMSGFSQWRDAQPAAGAAPTTGPASQFISENYLIDLAQSIKSQFGILPVYGTTGDFKTTDQLKDIEGIGKTFYMGPNYQTEDFAISALNVKDFLDDAGKQSIEGRKALSLWQPSSMMLDASSNLYYFRVSAIDPAHPATLEASKERVVADWKLAAAYDLAVKAARDVLADAKNRGLVVAAGAADASVIVTQPFNPQEIVSDTAGMAKITPLNLQPDSLHRFAADAQELLTTPPSSEGHPLSLAELYADATATVMELNSAKPLWDVQMQGPLESEVVRSAITQQRQSLLADYTRYDAVAQRMNYKPAANIRISD